MNFKPFFLVPAALAAMFLPAIIQAETVDLAHGETKVFLSSGFVSALGSLGVTPSAVGPASLYKTTASFPITVGLADVTNTLADIGHLGGLSLTAGSTKVELLNFQIEALPGTVAYISGIVTVNGAIVGRIPLFDLTIGSVYQPNKESLSIQNVTVALDGNAARALNSVFNVTAFVKGFGIGTASTMTYLVTEHRIW